MTTTMTPARRAEIRALAAQATPGPAGLSDSDARFAMLAAVDPGTVLALCDLADERDRLAAEQDATEARVVAAVCAWPRDANAKWLSASTGWEEPHPKDTPAKGEEDDR